MKKIGEYETWGDVPNGVLVSENLDESLGFFAIKLDDERVLINAKDNGLAVGWIEDDHEGMSGSSWSEVEL